MLNRTRNRQSSSSDSDSSSEDEAQRQRFADIAVSFTDIKQQAAASRNTSSTKNGRNNAHQHKDPSQNFKEKWPRFLEPSRPFQAALEKSPKDRSRNNKRATFVLIFRS